MPRIDILRKTPIRHSARITVLKSLMDYPDDAETEFRSSVDLDIPDKWDVGLIVGHSGSGKSTIARELFGDFADPKFSDDAPVFDCFSATPSETAQLLCAVGLSSVPTWLRPWRLLSGGEQFRATVAAIIANHADIAPAVIDEFTSVVDRQVAKAVSCCVAKYARRNNRKIVCVSCHYDIIDWLQPDWVIDMSRCEFTRRELRRRPDIELDISEVHAHKAWGTFEPHHYMTGKQSNSVRAWCAFMDGSAIAYSSYGKLPHAIAKNIMIGSRLVVLPDYQGLGIGKALDNFVAEHLYSSGYRVRNRTAHPGAQAMYQSDTRWRLVHIGRTCGQSKTSTISRNKAQKKLVNRVTRCYEFVP